MSLGNKDSKIGIIGVGYVGSALRRYFEGEMTPIALLDANEGVLPSSEATHATEIVPSAKAARKSKRTVYVYDKFKALGSVAEVNKADIIFIVVPTPYDEKKGFDRSALEDAFRIIKGAKTIVIKSTVLPGTTEYFQKKYPRLKVLMNPEFLTQSTADADMLFPDRQLIGYTAKSYDVAKDILNLLPLAPFSRVLPATEAEMVKYFANTWFSTKVTFANQMYDLCEKLGIRYDVVKESAAADRRIGRSHLEVWHKGSRGFGGACLPKDTSALVRFAEELGVDLALLKTALKINEKLRKLKLKTE